MTEPTITCPTCKSEIKLTESLAAPIVETAKKEYEKRLALKESEVSTREAAIRTQQEAIDKAKESIDEQVTEKLKKERSSIASEEAKKARLALSTDLEQKDKDLAELQTVIEEKNTKLAEAQTAQAELIRKTRELDDAKREMELTIEKRVQVSLNTTRESAKKEAEEELTLKLAERDQTISSMQQKIEELKKKADEGSQQLQGEALETTLEDLLRQHFPFDEIAPVPKGVFGGDVLQTVRDASGAVCGIILWESKRTKKWSDSWLPKLRDDQRAAKAQIAILVSQELPNDVTTFRHVDGIWVVSVMCAVSLTSALRSGLIEVAAAKRSLDGRNDKMELLYKYLSGSEFRHRLEGIVESFVTLQEELEKEKRAMQSQWARRQKQLERAVTQTTGMYGDLSGIIGASLPQIAHLGLPALGVVDESTADGVSAE